MTSGGADPTPPVDHAASFNLADLFEAAARAVPDRVAVAYGGHHLSYASLDERASRLAGWLAARGVGPGDFVGIQLYNGFPHLETVLAALKLRAAPVAVNHRYRAAELAYLYRDAGLAALVVEQDLAAEARRAAGDAGGPDVILEGGAPYEAALDASEPAPVPTRSGDDLYVIYTGGTTGMPKGVVWRQEDLYFAAMGGGNPGGEGVALPQDVAARVSEQPLRVFPACPLMHNSAQWVTWMFLTTGGTVVLAPDVPFDPEVIWDIAETEVAQSISIVGDAMARPLLDALDAHPDRWDLSQLFVVGSGGAVLSPATKVRIHDHLPHVLIMDACGSTETGQQGLRATLPGGEVIAAPDFDPQEGTLVLGDDMRPLEPGSKEIGLLARRGRVPLRYHNDPDKSARTFPVIDGVRYAVPGDAALLLADGTIELLGRGSSCITTGGEKVFPEEVETVLKEHPRVYDAVVVGVPDERWGARVAAVVQPAGSALDPEALRVFVRDRLAPYKVPKDVVVVDHVERSPAGKADLAWAASVASAASPG